MGRGSGSKSMSAFSRVSLGDSFTTLLLENCWEILVADAVVADTPVLVMFSGRIEVPASCTNELHLALFLDCWDGLEVVPPFKLEMPFGMRLICLAKLSLPGCIQAWP